MRHTCSGTNEVTRYSMSYIGTIPAWDLPRAALEVMSGGLESMMPLELV